MKVTRTTLLVGALCALLAGGTPSVAAVSADEAQKLKTTLTPLGGEKAGNADGSIPAWDGGYTTPIPGFENGGRRGDPFAAEKPLFSITPKNMDQYADKLTDGVKGMLQKYPDSFRVDVYPTHRTAAAPQWVYDNTFKNATRAAMDGDIPQGCYGGIPFPIPQSGAEVLWNHQLHWRGTDWLFDEQAFLLTADGKRVMTVDAVGDQQMPYYFEDGSLEKWNGEYWMIRLINSGPPIRAGEGIVGRNHVDADKTQAWVYLTGQRRVRKLPNPCCDTPTPAAAGVAGFDDLEVWTGRIDRFDWKILGKKEMYIPYNGNKLNVPTSVDAVIDPHHVNPDYFRWELHRVWVVEATLREGNRHQAPKGMYYFDEDTWNGVLADRWDASGRLWKTLWTLPIVMPDLPATSNTAFGYYDLVSGTAWISNFYNEKERHYVIQPRYPDRVFTGDALAGRGVR
ncbi:MAG: DUF1329 domain-containing protein [Deferrisomatales bacterium]|nr:DUF1329 domain-containing protein [Deferrisomatales bacterium]